MAGRLIVVAETAIFIRQAEKIWSEDERQSFINFIAANPETGDVIPDTGGVRKVRWRRAGAGKRGGTRVIYFYYSPNRPLYLLFVYAKSQREDLTAEEKREVREIAAFMKRNS